MPKEEPHSQIPTEPYCPYHVHGMAEDEPLSSDTVDAI
jgi:hypothetical protein